MSRRRKYAPRTPGTWTPSPWTPSGVIGACVWAFDGYRLAIVHIDKIDGTRPQARELAA